MTSADGRILVLNWDLGKSVALGTESAGSIHPVLLDQVVPTAERHVIQRTIAGCGGRPEGPSALVCILSATSVVPCV